MRTLDLIYRKLTNPLNLSDLIKKSKLGTRNKEATTLAMELGFVSMSAYETPYDYEIKAGLENGNLLFGGFDPVIFQIKLTQTYGPDFDGYEEFERIRPELFDINQRLDRNDRLCIVTYLIGIELASEPYHTEQVELLDDVIDLFDLKFDPYIQMIMKKLANVRRRAPSRLAGGDSVYIIEPDIKDGWKDMWDFFFKLVALPFLFALLTVRVILTLIFDYFSEIQSWFKKDDRINKDNQKGG